MALLLPLRNFVGLSAIALPFWLLAISAKTAQVPASPNNNMKTYKSCSYLRGKWGPIKELSLSADVMWDLHRNSSSKRGALVVGSRELLTILAFIRRIRIFCLAKMTHYFRYTFPFILIGSKYTSKAEHFKSAKQIIVSTVSVMWIISSGDIRSHGSGSRAPLPKIDNNNNLI